VRKSNKRLNTRIYIRHPAISESENCNPATSYARE